jgi:glycosyltransferase involved in cell wall biosynthesis
MDDDMSTLSQHHIAFRLYSTRTASKFSWRNAVESCKAATMVTTSTSTLQHTYANPGRGVVLDNYLPAACLRFDEPKPEPGFGWAGTVSSHPDDLQVVGNSVQKLIDEGHAFRVVGDGKKLKAPLRLREDPWATGGLGLDQWVRTMQRTLQVGMVPLASTKFNASKSRLKGIEYMAGGIPWVASPRQEYRRLVRESGCGLLADTPKQWYQQLKLLLTDEVLRKEQVEAGREYMKDQTYEDQAWRWAEAWERAVEIQKGS